MAVKTVRHRNNRGSADTSRNPSRNIWADCPWNAIKEGAVSGVCMEDDFTSFNKTAATTEGNWGAELSYAQFAGATGTITAGTGQGGEAVFGATEDDEGVSIRTLSTPFKISRSLKQFWFECRVKSSTITDTKHSFFVGLVQNVAFTAIIPLTATSALADYNMVGFHRLEGDGDAVDTVYKADGVTAVTVGADAVTLVADTYVKLGMVFRPFFDANIADTGLTNANKWILSFYLDNLKLSDHKQIPSADGTDFPNDVGLGLAFALNNATGTSEGTTTMDWWRACQLI